MHLLQSQAVLRGLNERPESGHEGDREIGEPDGRSHQRGRPSTQDKQRVPSPLMPTGRKGQHIQRSPPSPVPGGGAGGRGLTFHAGSLSSLPGPQRSSGHHPIPSSLQVLQGHPPASPTWEPLRPLTLPVGLDPPSLDPLSVARDRTLVLLDASRVLTRPSHNRNSKCRNFLILRL